MVPSRRVRALAAANALGLLALTLVSTGHVPLLGQATTPVLALECVGVSGTTLRNNVYTTNVTLKNVGSATWTANSTYVFEWYGPESGGAQPLAIPSKYVGADVAPGGTATVTMTFPRPAVTGTYPLFFGLADHPNLNAMAAQRCGVFLDVGLPTPPTVPVVECADNSQVPSTVVAGNAFSTTMRMKNIGPVMWRTATQEERQRGESHTYAFERPGIDYVDESRPFNSPSVIFEQAYVLPGGIGEIRTNSRAPSTPGTYTYKWRVAENMVGLSTGSCSKTITVTPSVNGSQCVESNVPSTLEPGNRFFAQIKVKNTGTRPWHGPNHYLHIDKDFLATWGLTNAGAVWSGWPETYIEPGQTATIAVSGTAPATPGNYQFDWRMTENTVEHFGPVCAKTITVQAQASSSSASSISSSAASSVTSVASSSAASSVSSATTAFDASLSLETPESVQQGQVVNGHLFLRNLSQQELQSYTVTIPIPAGLAYGGAVNTANGCQLTQNQQAIECTAPGILGPGATRDFNVGFAMQPSIECGANVTYVATLHDTVPADANASNNIAQNSIAVACANSSVSSAIGLTQCNDGLDNDGDTAVDYPADTGCTSSQDDTEADGTASSAASSESSLSSTAASVSSSTGIPCAMDSTCGTPLCVQDGGSARFYMPSCVANHCTTLSFTYPMMCPVTSSSSASSTVSAVSSASSEISSESSSEISSEASSESSSEVSSETSSESSSEVSSELSSESSISSEESSASSENLAGNLYVTKSLTPLLSRQFLGGSHGSGALSLNFRAEHEAIVVTDLHITSTGSAAVSVDRLELIKIGETLPFATATSGDCQNDDTLSRNTPANDLTFCASFDNRELVIPAGEQIDVLVTAKMKTDAQGGFSHDVIRFIVDGTAASNNQTGSGAVRARRDIADNGDLLPNDGNSIAEGEVFIGTNVAAPNNRIQGQPNVSVLAKIVSITNGSPDVDGTAIPLGLHSIGAFSFSGAVHTNTLNGLNAAVLKTLVFTVNATNVQMQADGFALYNTKHSEQKFPCVAYNNAGAVALQEITGGFQVLCEGLAASGSNLSGLTRITMGSGLTLALQGMVLDDNTTSNGNANLQVSLANFTSIAATSAGIGTNPSASHLLWADQDAVSSVDFFWVEFPNTVVNSTRYGDNLVVRRGFFDWVGDLLRASLLWF